MSTLYNRSNYFSVLSEPILNIMILPGHNLRVLTDMFWWVKLIVGENGTGSWLIVHISRLIVMIRKGV